jgi:Ser/Thr protein kinase RdoA (MazF antagonist)
MTIERVQQSEAIPTAELRLGLEKALSTHFGEPVSILELDRQPWVYQSSFALEALRVYLGPRGTLALIFKDLSWHALSPEAQRAKPKALYDPLREIRVYEDALRFHPRFGPTCYGTVIDSNQARYWLFVEHVNGQELYQVGEFGVWEFVARWLAQMHAALQPFAAANTELQEHLIKHDSQEQEKWFRRACRAVGLRGSDNDARQLSELSKVLPDMACALSARSPDLIHGEFYPSNILIAGSLQAGLRVCAVDWEMAGFGCELLDLAALVAGGWTQEQQNALALAYYEETCGTGGKWQDEQQFFQTLDHCRLNTALRWLGWSDDWSPPPAHAHDWLEEALSVGERLTQRSHRRN